MDTKYYKATATDGSQHDFMKTETDSGVKACVDVSIPYDALAGLRDKLRKRIDTRDTGTPPAK